MSLLTTPVPSEPTLPLEPSPVTLDGPDFDPVAFERFINYETEADSNEESHPASSQVWRSLLAERMARSHDPRRPIQSFERAVEARRRERDIHLELAADARRREREAQRNLMDVQRETLRAAERTISLLREQIRLHDERARLSIASLVPSPAPADTPARTPTQRAALERSLSARIASLQADIERERRRAGFSGPMRRPETEAAARLRGTNSLVNAACPHASTSPGSLHASGHRSGHNRRLTDHDARPLPTPTLLEREWDFQLASGQVDANGVDLPKSETSDIDNSSKPSTSNLGCRHVEDVGFQSASKFASSNYGSATQSSSQSRVLSWPACLR
ncbi:hypothetical protein CROQUDRAFT_661848 [Cronartium quercuum f. sp. fusiforme G11]|uniref:Uncharacterized protein n=1 Tax=Cronartium quercuum f. sp. fusiforme G11 TaxID=708437 RepID=A0A9P6NFB5_9BASI|nr:hypothetical protein CROQUDRAFT_661848 [Cronartium quercuum f. sp. fusiforme G11]